MTAALTAPAELLRVDGLHISFGPLDVVRGVDLRLAPGEVLGIVGESGSGKSLTALSLMRLLPRGARISSGRVMFDGVDLQTLSDRQLNARRGRDIAMIFQDPLSALNPSIPVGRQIADSLGTHRGLTGRAAQARVEELLDTVGIAHPAARARAYPHELSGGMRQRVMTALAVACDPKLLIADEPTTALDVTVQAQIMAMLANLRRRLGIAMLFISHNLDLVAQIADRVTVMYGGRVVESAAAQKLFGQPCHPYTQALLRCVPRLDGETGELPTIPGLPPRFGAMMEGCAFAPRCPLAEELCTHPPPIRRASIHGVPHVALCWKAEM